MIANYHAPGALPVLNAAGTNTTTINSYLLFIYVIAAANNDAFEAFVVAVIAGLPGTSLLSNNGLFNYFSEAQFISSFF